MSFNVSTEVWSWYANHKQYVLDERWVGSQGELIDGVFPLRNEKTCQRMNEVFALADIDLSCFEWKVQSSKLLWNFKDKQKKNNPLFKIIYLHSKSILFFIF